MAGTQRRIYSGNRVIVGPRSRWCQRLRSSCRNALSYTEPRSDGYWRNMDKMVFDYQAKERPV